MEKTQGSIDKPSWPTEQKSPSANTMQRMKGALAQVKREEIARLRLQNADLRNQVSASRRKLAGLERDQTKKVDSLSSEVDHMQAMVIACQIQMRNLSQETDTQLNVTALQQQAVIHQITSYVDAQVQAAEQTPLSDRFTLQKAIYREEVARLFRTLYDLNGEAEAVILHLQSEKGNIASSMQARGTLTGKLQASRTLQTHLAPREIA